jgi:flavin reductase (DIM6/NTAB) family NADH-FMN oxidoreductase RutF
MNVAHAGAAALRRVLLGNTNLPQQCTVGIPDPQTEVRVWLHGAGEPRDVTFAHSIACAAPFTICIGEGQGELDRTADKLALRFQEADGKRRLLAELRLQHTATMVTTGPRLHLFQVRGSKNYCLPRSRLWAHYLHQAYLRWRHRGSSHIRISAGGAHAMIASFICPRPVVLVSAVAGDRSNMFPMNLLGRVSDGYFAFALDSTRLAAPLVASAGRVALSSIPLEHSGAARQLGKNHKQESVPWDQIPFPTTMSAAFHLPVPCFASRVMEMQIEKLHNLGSHTFFVARVIRDERRGQGQQFCMVHGVYQSWRLMHRQEL